MLHLCSGQPFTRNALHHRLQLLKAQVLRADFMGRPCLPAGPCAFGCNIVQLCHGPAQAGIPAQLSACTRTAAHGHRAEGARCATAAHPTAGVARQADCMWCRYEPATAGGYCCLDALMSASIATNNTWHKAAEVGVCCWRRHPGESSAAQAGLSTQCKVCHWCQCTSRDAARHFVN